MFIIIICAPEREERGRYCSAAVEEEVAADRFES